MPVYKEKIELYSHGVTPTFINITPQIKAAIASSGIQEGIVTVISPHTTCSVFFEEFVHDLLPDGTEFLQDDLNKALQRIFPDQTEIPPPATTAIPAPSTTQMWPPGPTPRTISPAATRPLCSMPTPT